MCERKDVDNKYEPKAREQLLPAEVAANYNAADRHLDPGALAAIETWLAAQAGLVAKEGQG